MMLRRSLQLGGIFCCGLLWSSCGKQEPASAGPPDGAGANASGQPAILAYQESVRASMNNLQLKMSFIGESGQREEWEGRLTIEKDRFATVVHPAPERKEVHLRRWANVHIAEIPASGEPRANRTEESPLTGQELIADRLDDGAWTYQFASDAVEEEKKKLLSELDRVEAGAASFYAGHKLVEGESWQVPADALVRWFGDEVDGYAGDINVRVDRTETLQNHECAVLVVSFKAAGKMHDPDGQTLDMEMDAAGEIWRATTIDEDLKVEIHGSVTLKAAVPAREILLTIVGPLVITEDRKIRL